MDTRELPDSTTLKTLKILKPSSPRGYEAPHLWPLFTTALTSALLLNEFVLPHYAIAVPHAAVVVLFGFALAVHEVARPCAECWSDTVVLFCGAVVHTLLALVAHARRGFKPRFDGWSGTFHIVQAVLSNVCIRHGHTVFWLHNAQHFRRNLDWFGRLQGWFSCRSHGTTCESFRYNGLEHLWVRSSGAASVTPTKDLQDEQPLVILYFHGGGFSSMSPHVYTDFCNRLHARVTLELAAPQHQTLSSSDSAHVLIANYRKLPEVTYPTPVDDCVMMYEYLTTELQVPTHRIVLAGDSAGAGLVLSTLLRVRDAATATQSSSSKSTTSSLKTAKLPLLAICVCPFVDFSGDEALASHCIMQPTVSNSLRAYCTPATGASELDAWHEAHVVARDLSGLPPLLIQTGAFDVFHQHALRLAHRAAADGIIGYELDVHAEMPHVFSVFPKWLLPGSERGIARMAHFIATHVALQRTQSGVSDAPCA